MRSIIFSALILFAAFAALGFWTASAAQTFEPSNDSSSFCKACYEAWLASQKPKTYNVVLTGDLKDADSVKKVQDLLKAMAGVTEVTINANDKKAEITLEKGKSLSKEMIEKALKDSGFGVTTCDEKAEEEKAKP